MINFNERMLPTRRRSYPQPPDQQLDAHPTEPPRPARVSYIMKYASCSIASFCSDAVLSVCHAGGPASIPGRNI